MPKISLFFAILLVACGGAQSGAKPTHPGHEHEGDHTHVHRHADGEHDHPHGDHHHADGDHHHADGHHPHGEHHHGEDGSAVSALHAKLAPLWHAPAGDKRTSDICAAASEMHALGSKIVEESAQASATELARAKELEQTAAALKAECETSERKEFAAKLTAFHDAFHRVADEAAH